jgi:6-phosphogluconolactonase/glucosamine-6-phosphate isomerase/deaminase
VSTTVETFADSDGLAAAAGERLIGAIDAAAAARGRALIVLTGGGNGNRLLSYLGAQGQRIDWAKVHLFWGDERYVAEDDDERNDKQALDALLNHIDIPARCRTSNSWPRTPNRATPHRISTSTCSAWDPKATSIRCSRTLQPCAKPPGWWSVWRIHPSPRRNELR